MRETTLHFASCLDAGFAAIGQPALRVALTSGGDERLAIDPRTGRNRYGVPAGPAPHETSFASSTASQISMRGHVAAEVAFHRLLTGGPRTAIDWAEGIGARLLQLYGIPGTEAILTASGTEAEFVVLSLARNILERPLVSLVLAPDETGSGVGLAAAGRHFLGTTSLGRAVERSTHLDGLTATDVAVEGIDIRDPDGKVLGAAAVDQRVLRRAQAALRGNRDVLVHCLDASKTGLAGFSRSTAEAMEASAPDRCLVVVDACQLRCSADAIRRDLAAGFLVVITGSKFAGGPAFAGAVLVPPAVVERLGRIVLPAGLAAYSALNDWPAALRSRLEAPLPTTLNIGLGLRWEAALAELDAFHAVEPALRQAIVAGFGALVAHEVEAREGFAAVPADAPDGVDRPRTIFPILTTGHGGSALDAHALHRGLMAPESAEGAGVFHVGQPVGVGPVSALRVCLAAPQINAVAARAATATLEQAMAPLAADLGALFAKWSALRVRAMAEAPRSQRRA